MDMNDFNTLTPTLISRPLMSPPEDTSVRVYMELLGVPMDDYSTYRIFFAKPRLLPNWENKWLVAHCETWSRKLTNQIKYWLANSSWTGVETLQGPDGNPVFLRHSDSFERVYHTTGTPPTGIYLARKALRAGPLEFNLHDHGTYAVLVRK